MTVESYDKETDPPDCAYCCSWGVFISTLVYAPVLFLLIIGTGCLSRVLIHIMIWKIRPPNLNSTLNLITLRGRLVPDTNRITRAINCTNSTCSGGLPLEWTCTPISGTTCSLAEEIPSVHVAWYWALMLCISAPYVYTLLTNLSRWCTKRVYKWKWRIFLMVC